MLERTSEAYKNLVAAIVCDATDDVTESLSTFSERGKRMEGLVVLLGPERTRRAEAAAARIAARTPYLASGAPNPAYLSSKRNLPAA